MMYKKEIARKQNNLFTPFFFFFSLPNE